MCEEALEEMAVLSSIYCEKDEFELIEESAQTGLVYRLQTAIETGTGSKALSLVFHVPPQYPQVPPDISVTSSQLSRSQCQDLRRVILNKAQTLPPEPMVHQLLTWFQQSSSSLLMMANTRDVQSSSESEAEQVWTALLHLDHMRSRSKYIKLIEKWTTELGLTGRLFTGKLILILLQGAKESIKEYIHLQRTVKVDVDSSGKRCKEKMMKVLCEVPLTDESQKISGFEVKEDLSLDDLKKEFDLTGSVKLYQEFVPSLL